MQIDKGMVLDLLTSQGKSDEARQADGRLPQQVDTERDAGLLQELGIDPHDLVTMLTGGGGSGPGGGLGGMLGGR